MSQPCLDGHQGSVQWKRVDCNLDHAYIHSLLSSMCLSRGDHTKPTHDTLGGGNPILPCNEPWWEHQMNKVRWSPDPPFEHSLCNGKVRRLLRKDTAKLDAPSEVADEWIQFSAFKRWWNWVDLLDHTILVEDHPFPVDV